MSVELDDEVCLCFHVTKRKLVNFLRIERPKRAAQMSECFGAGTGCGWCRSYLQRMFERHAASAGGETATTTDEPTLDEPAQDEPTAQDHARGRADYVRGGGGTPPPGATPIEDAP